MHRLECNRNEVKWTAESTNNEGGKSMVGYELNYVIRAEGRADILALRDFRKTVLSRMGNGGNIPFPKKKTPLQGRDIKSVSRLSVSLKVGEKPCASFVVRTRTLGDTHGPMQVELRLKQPEPVQS